jgi:agmatinase
MSSLDTFNPDAKALKESGIYGLPCNEAESRVVVIPVPWEATTSYGSGAS